jgi:hypothetical protein
LSGTTVKTASDGVVTFTDLKHDTASTITIDFTGTGLITATSSSIQVTSAAQYAWRNSHFSAGDLADPSKEATVWGDLADPDGDGRLNLMEYALGLDPLNGADAGDAITSSVVTDAGNVYNALTFKHRLTDPSLTYQVEVSGDKVSWTTGTVTLTPTGINAEFEWATVRDGTPISSGGARFIRLHIIKP